MVYIRLLIIAVCACLSMRATEVFGTVSFASPGDMANAEGWFDLTGDGFHITGFLGTGGQSAYCPICFTGRDGIGPTGETDGPENLALYSAVVNGVDLNPHAPTAGVFRFSGPFVSIQPITEGIASYALPFTFTGQLFYPSDLFNPPPPCTFCEPDLTGSGTAVITLVPGGYPDTARVTGETYYFGVTSVPEPGTLFTVMPGLGIILVAQFARTIGARTA